MALPLSSVYTFDRGTFSNVATVYDSSTNTAKYELTKNALTSDYSFYRCCENNQGERQRLWKINKRLLRFKYGITYVGDCRNKEEAKLKKEVGWIKVKGWFKYSYRCQLHEQVLVQWRIKKWLTNFIIVASVYNNHQNAGKDSDSEEEGERHTKVEKEQEEEEEEESPHLPLAKFTNTNMFAYKGNIIIYWDELLKQYPGFKGREEELGTFMLATALVSKWDWDLSRSSKS